ncbi:MAG: phage tail family protein, partial [Coprobacillus sp.]
MYNYLKFNGTILNDIGTVYSIERVLLPEKSFSTVSIPSRDGELLSGCKYNPLVINVKMLVEGNDEFNYKLARSQIRDILNVRNEVPIMFFEDRVCYGIVTSALTFTPKTSLACHVEFTITCNMPYCYNIDSTVYNSIDGKTLQVQNNGGEPTTPFITIGFGEDTYFVQLENTTTKQKLLVGAYPKENLVTVIDKPTVLFDECQVTTNWVKSAASIDSNRNTEGTMTVTGDGEGFCLGTVGTKTATWAGSCYRTNLNTSIEEFEVEAYFTHDSTGTNGDPTIKKPGKNEMETVITGKKTYYYQVTCSSLNVRTGASTKYKKLCAVTRGHKIKNGTMVKGWLKFTWDKYPGKDCYVSGQYITKMTDDTTKTESRINKVTKINTIIYASPTLNSKKLKVIPSGSTIRVIYTPTTMYKGDDGKTYEFVKLSTKYEGIMGYVTLGNLVNAADTIISYPTNTTWQTADDKTGMIELYGFDTNGAKLFKMSLLDDSEWYEYTRPEISVGGDIILKDKKTVPAPVTINTITDGSGGNTSTITPTNYLSGQFGDWNNFFGKLVIRREKKGEAYKWNAEIQKLKNGSIVKKQLANISKDLPYETTGLSYLVLYMGTKTDKMEKCSDMSLQWVKVQRLNPTVTIEQNIHYFKAGDILDIDFNNRHAYINMSNRDDLVDIGS